MITFTIISNSSKITWPLKRQKRDLKFHIFHLNTFIPPKRLPGQHAIVISIFDGWTVRIRLIYSTREISDPQNYSSFVYISSDALLILQVIATQVIEDEENRRKHSFSYQRKDELQPKLYFVESRWFFSLACEPFDFWYLVLSTPLSLSHPSLC